MTSHLRKSIINFSASALTRPHYSVLLAPGITDAHVRVGLTQKSSYRCASSSSLAQRPSIVVGCDGFGEDLKDKVVEHLQSKGFKVEDLGCDKYYNAAADVAKKVQSSTQTGILFCGTGMGVSIMANKFEGVYTALVENEAAARRSRAINNANVLALGGLVTEPSEAAKIVDAFLEQDFVSAPNEDGKKPEWWKPEVEEFLKGSMLEVAEVEQEAFGNNVVQNDITKEKESLEGKTIVVGCDGFGEDLKNRVVGHLKAKGYTVQDLGCDKYYVAAANVAKKVQSDRATHTGMLFCGTGMGVSIIANKFEGVYTALVENEVAARRSRAINNANVLALGGLVTESSEAAKIVDAFLEQGFVSAPNENGKKPEWWKPEVEEFLKGSMPELADVEKKSRIGD